MIAQNNKKFGSRRNAIYSLVAVALSFMTGLCFCGCATAPIEVSDSQLNWLEINFQPAAEGEKPCKINLIGVGYIDFIEGTSPRVASGFAVNTDASNWQDAYQERLGVQPRVLRAWLQRFVDVGIMTERRRSKLSDNGTTKADLAVCLANINCEKALCVTKSEPIVGMVRELIRSIKNHTVEDIK